MARHFGQTLQWFTACLFGDDPVRLEPATTWTDDLWFLDQDNREVLGTDGWWPLPVLANVDAGHTSPMATLPIGGQITMSAEPGDLHLVLTQH